MNVKRRLIVMGLILSFIILIFGGQNPVTVMADDTKIVETVGSGPCWSSSGSWNSWKNWYINKGYTINGSGKTILWWNRKDHEAWWLGVKDKNGNSKWVLLFDGVQTTSGNYITRYNGWMLVREGKDIVWYYLDNEGCTYTNMWLHTRCVDSNYKASDKHGYFYFDGSGRLQTGWLRDSSGGWYYSDSQEGSVNPGISEHGGLSWTTIKNPTSYEKDGLYSNGLYYLNGLNVVTNVYRMNTNGSYDYIGNTVNNIKVGDGNDQINPLKEKTINADTDYVNKQIYNSKGLFINTNAEGSYVQQQNLALKNGNYKQIKINEFTYYIDRKKFTLTQNINSDTETTKTSSIYFEGATTIEDPSAKAGYTFTTWNLQGNESELNDRTFVMGDEDAVLTAQWTANVYTNSIGHWAGGFENHEGNNGGENDAFKLNTIKFQSPYGRKFTMDSTKAVKIPNGFNLGKDFNTPAIDDGMWKIYSLGTIIQQKAFDMYFEYYYYPVNYSITYNLNGGINNSLNPSTYNVLYGVSLKAPTRTEYTFTGWYDENSNKITGINEGCNATFSSVNDLYAKLAKRTTGNKTLTAHWSYNPVSVKVPQVLIANHAGSSQFRVKCDDLKAGNIKISVPNSFLYKQSGKANVTAAITAKSGNNTITPTNKVCVYNITTQNGLSAGCWSGSFNIGLTLTKK